MQRHLLAEILTYQVRCLLLLLDKVCESVPMHARDISPMEADTAKVKKVDPS